MLRRLEELENCDPGEYWRFWKSLQNRTSQSNVIDASTFAVHYKASNSPPNCEEFDRSNMNEITNSIVHYDAANKMNIDDVPTDILNAPISQGEI